MGPATTPVLVKPELVAACGLYCAACGSYRKGRCPGCRDNEKATWCKVRSCCSRHGWATCAECTEHTDPASCGLYNNFISKVIGLVLNSDRRACIVRIRELGRDGFAAHMGERGIQTLPRRNGARQA